MWKLKGRDTITVRLKLSEEGKNRITIRINQIDEGKNISTKNV